MVRRRPVRMLIVAWAVGCFGCAGVTPPPPEPAAPPPAATRGSCDAGDWAACHTEAERYARGGSSEENFPLAAQMFDNACAGGHAAACADLALLHILGQGVPTDKLRAGDLQTRACELGWARSCYNKAYSLNVSVFEAVNTREPWTDEDDAWAKKLNLEIKALLQKACELGEKDACSSVETGIAPDEMIWEWSNAGL